MEQEFEFIPDEIYGERLLISTRADKRELSSNIRAARAILHSFSDIYIIINTHTIELGHKNPEYTINSRLGDRKGIMSERELPQGLSPLKNKDARLLSLTLTSISVRYAPLSYQDIFLVERLILPQE